MYRSSLPYLYGLLYVYELSPVFVWLTVCIGVLSRVCMVYFMYRSSLLSRVCMVYYMYRSSLPCLYGLLYV